MMYSLRSWEAHRPSKSQAFDFGGSLFVESSRRRQAESTRRGNISLLIALYRRERAMEFRSVVPAHGSTDRRHSLYSPAPSR
jgi:hypothetical protein